MTTATVDQTRAEPAVIEESVGSKIVRILGRLPIHLILAAIGLLTAVSAPLAARYALAAAPVADSLGTWASLFATWLLARRIIDTWAWWIAIDLGLGALFIRQGLLPTGALYLAFALLAIAGWQSWRRPRAPA